MTKNTLHLPEREVQEEVRFARDAVRPDDIRVEAAMDGRLPELPKEALNDERFVYKYVRVLLDGEDDVKNISDYERLGWRFCRPEDIPGVHNMPVRTLGFCRGAVGIGDVAIAKLPREIAEARRKLHEKRTAEMMQAINSQLLREGDSRMPTFNESRSIVRTGRAAEFDTT